MKFFLRKKKISNEFRLNKKRDKNNIEVIEGMVRHNSIEGKR